MELQCDISLQVVAGITVVLTHTYIYIHSMNPTVSQGDCQTLSFGQIRLS